MKIFVALAFFLIFASLFSAFIFMMKDRSRSKRTAKALTVRIGASVVLFIIIIALHYFGMIQSTGIR